MLANQYFIKYHSQTVDISPGFHCFTACLLRRDIIQRPNNVIRFRQVIVQGTDQFRNTKITQISIAIFIEQNVGRFYIAMDDVISVSQFQSRCDLIKQQDWMKGVVKLVGAGAAVKWGDRVFGSTGSKALAILLAYDGIRSLIPIDAWSKKAADTVTGMVPMGGLGGYKPDVENQAGGGGSNPPRDYYADLYGGAR